MSRAAKLLRRIVDGRSSTNVRFTELCALLRRFGFEETTHGSHHVFRRSDVAERLNLQAEGADAKPYPVRQVRRILLTYGLTELPRSEDAH